MASAVTFMLFFIYFWGLGFGATYFVNKRPEHWLERHLVYLAVGLAVFPILAVILNAVRVPLDWKIFLALSLLVPGWVTYCKYKAKAITFSAVKPNIVKLDKTTMYLLGAVLITAVMLFIYTQGAFSYPYLEDEDPWGHAEGIRYVSLEKTAYDPVTPDSNRFDFVLSYIDPYPPAYDVLFGVLLQTSNDIRWTMKFFNALLLSLSYLFFFLFVRKFADSNPKALLATLFLAATPAYMSHFFWAFTLVVLLIFPTMYALEYTLEDRRWAWIALVAVASIWVSQNMSHPIKITAMLLIYTVVSAITRRQWLKEHFIAIGGGVLLSFAWWGMTIARYGAQKLFVYYGQGAAALEAAASQAGGEAVTQTNAASFSSFIVKLVSALTQPGGTSARAYGFKDFFYARSDNLINSPIGLGAVLTLLVLSGVIFVLWKRRSLLVDKKNTWLLVAMFWLVYFFWVVNGVTFPISIAKDAFRSWMLLAIPVAMVAAQSAYFWRSLIPSRLGKVLLIFILIGGVMYTSGVAKYKLNTSVWPTSSAFTPQEALEYAAWFDTLPEGTSVFWPTRPKIVVGFGKMSCTWCADEIDFREGYYKVTPEELHVFMRERGYDYLLFGFRNDLKYFRNKIGEEQVEEKLQQRYQEILESQLFLPVYQKEGVFLALKRV